MTPTPEQARRTIIASMHQGREYTFNDLKNRTGLTEGQITRNLIELRKMGLIADPQIVQDVRAYRLAERVPA